MNLPQFFWMIRFPSRSLVLFIQALFYSIHSCVVILHKVLAQFWLGSLIQPRDRILIVIFKMLSFLQTTEGDVCSSSLVCFFFPHCEALIFIGRKKKSSQQTIFFCVPNKRTASSPKGEWGRWSALVLFQFQDVWLLSANGTILILWCLETWPFYPVWFSLYSFFLFVLFCYNLYKTVI